MMLLHRRQPTLGLGRGLRGRAAPGGAIEHNGYRYPVNPNPVHSWPRSAQPTVLLSVTTIDAGSSRRRSVTTRSSRRHRCWVRRSSLVLTPGWVSGGAVRVHRLTHRRVRPTMSPTSEPVPSPRTHDSGQSPSLRRRTTPTTAAQARRQRRVRPRLRRSEGCVRGGRHVWPLTTDQTCIIHLIPTPSGARRRNTLATRFR
jgi:hypothetical protein